MVKNFSAMKETAGFTASRGRLYPHDEVRQDGAVVCVECEASASNRNEEEAAELLRAFDFFVSDYAQEVGKPGLERLLEAIFYDDNFVDAMAEEESDAYAKEAMPVSYIAS